MPVLLLAVVLALVSAAELWVHAGSSVATPETTAALSRELAGDPASPYRWCDLGEGLAELSRESDRRMGGTVWIDDVEIAPAGPERAN
jgi:hypothetical protein